MRRERDSQRSKAYEAENTVFRKAGAVYCAEFSDINGCRDYIHKTLGRAVFINRYGRNACRPVDVKPGKGCHASFGESITLATWGYSRWMCLHELAHIIAYRLNYGTAKPPRIAPGSRYLELAWCSLSDRPAGHGWRWASIYLDLVRFMLGQETHDELKTAFMARGVRTRPKIKRVLSPTQQAAFERFIAARKRPAEPNVEWEDPYESW